MYKKAGEDTFFEIERISTNSTKIEPRESMNKVTSSVRFSMF